MDFSQLLFGKKSPKPVLVPEAGAPLMRRLEPRIVLDAAGGEDFIDAATGSVHGALADKYLNDAAYSQSSALQIVGLAENDLQHGAPFSPDLVEDTRQGPIEIAFVVGGVEDAETLVSQMPYCMEIIYLSEDTDGLRQMADILDGRQDIDAIHIVSHGSAGSLSLGEATVTTSTMTADYSRELAVIGSALTEQGDILVYGCDFARGEIGKEAVDTLARLTNADVAASEDRTGHQGFAGDWDLEVNSGAVEATTFDAGTAWTGVLADPSIDSDGGGFIAFVDVDENETFVTTVTASDPDLPADSLTYSIVGGGDQDQFTINPVSGELRFKTAPDFENQTDNFPTNGIYTVLVRATDSSGGEDTQSISVVVRDVDETVAANPDNFSVVEDGSISLDVLDNDIDPEGNSLSITQVDGQVITEGGPAVPVANGSVRLVSGELVFQPLENFVGPTSFSYVVSDGNGNTSNATVSGTVTSMNDAPVAFENTYALDEDNTLSGNAIADDTGIGRDSDVDGDTLELVPGLIGVFATARGGSIMLAQDGNFTYTAPANFSGTDSFTYTLTDGVLQDSATLTFFVMPVNDHPVLDDDGLTVPEDGFVSIDVLANDSDPDDDDLTITQINGLPVIDGGPSTPVPNGSVALSGGELVFTPTANYSGPVSFSYTVTDGNGATHTANVVGVVGGTNDAPDASDNSFTVQEEGTVLVDVLANDTDLDANSLTIVEVGGSPIIDGGPAVSVTNATVRLVAGNLQITPSPNYSGALSFTYTISDSNGGFDTAQVHGTVTPLNDAPSGTDMLMTTTEDVPIEFEASDFGFSDLEDNPSNGLEAVIINTLPPFGTLSLGGVAVTAGQTINAADLGELEFSPALNSNDGTTPGSTLSSFTFQVVDDGGSGGGNVNTDPVANTIVLSVLPSNDAPSAVANNYVTNEDTSVSGNALLDDTGAGQDNDVDGDALTMAAFSVGMFTTQRGGSITIAANGAFDYTPALNFVGLDTFSYSITDGALTDTETISFTVVSVNDVPVATGGAVMTVEDTPYTFSVADFGYDDQESDALSSITIDSVALAGGALTHSSGVPVTNGTTLSDAQITTLIFRPGANSSAPAGFDYTVNDADAGIVTASMTISVVATNDAPVALDNTYTSNEDTNLIGNAITEDTGAGRDSDPDGDALALDPASTGVFATAKGGSINLTQDGNFTYAPSVNFNGTDSFTYTLTDGVLQDTATLIFQVLPVNDSPLAINDVFTVPQDGSISIDVMANDNDQDGDFLIITEVNGQPLINAGPAVPVANGTVALLDEKLLFAPVPQYNGPASFNYTVSDGNGATQSGTVSGTVIAINRAPVAADKVYTTSENMAFSGNAIFDDTGLGVDADPEGAILSLEPISVGSFNTAAGGTIVLTAVGNFTYTPPNNFSGVDRFVYTVSDGERIDIGELTFNVTQTNFAPTAVDDVIFVDQDSPGSGNVLTGTPDTGRDSDPDGDALQLATSSLGSFITDQGGSITLLLNGDFIYAPPTGFSGTDTFVYGVTDGQLIDTARVTFEVSAAAPLALPDDIAPDDVQAKETDPLVSLEDESEEDEPEAQGIIIVPPPVATNVAAPAPAPAPAAPTPIQESPAPQADEEEEPVVQVAQSQPVPTLKAPSAPEVGEETPTFVFQPVDYPRFSDDLDRTREDIREYEGILSTTTAKVTFTFGAILGVGSVSWLLQSGILAATVLSALPAWKRFDPIAVVSSGSNDRPAKERSDLEMIAKRIKDAGTYASRV